MCPSPSLRFPVTAGPFLDLMTALYRDGRDADHIMSCLNSMTYFAEEFHGQNGEVEEERVVSTEERSVYGDGMLRV